MTIFPITVPIKYLLGDLVCSKKDGEPSITRLAAICAHGSAFALFVWHNLTGPYNEALWVTYLGFSTGHAAYDKTSQIVADLKAKAAQNDA